MSDRKRSPNWQLEEKILLVDLVTEHYHIVENKKTDGAAMKQKTAEWIKISDEFNSQTAFIHRTAENLKAQWDSLKKYTKREASEGRQSQIHRGVGYAKAKSNDQLFTKILGLLSTSVVEPCEQYDSDANINMYDEMEDTPQNTFPSINSIKHEESEENTADWEDYTPQMKPAIKSPSLQSEKEENVSDHQEVTEGQSELRTSLFNGNLTHRNKHKIWNSKHVPALKTSSVSLECLHEKKIKATEMQMNFAAEEREQAKALFNVELEIKKEKLKQEKIKTRFMLAQLRSTYKRIKRK